MAGGSDFSFSFSEGKKLFECLKMLFCPSGDGGGVVAIADQSEKDDGENGAKGLVSSVFGAWVGNGMEALNEEFECFGVRWGLGHDKLPC